ncbi:MAG TPA: recombinase family protein [Polyangia bacterium]|jgi:Site-specific recombinases, DNA invertase Pin homologs|nr:recombinase family protein [Polyangia bacterium]
MKAAVYLRVSTDKQSEANQEPDCRRLCEARAWEPIFYREVQSGAKKRPVWDRLKDDVRTGAVRAVVFWALDRTGRNRVQIAHDLGELFRFSAQVASVKDAWLDMPAGPMRDLLVQIMAWVAEGERSRLVERTNAGLARARLLGHRLGRPALPSALRLAIEQARGAGESAYLIAKRLALKETTVRRYVRRFDTAKKGHTWNG